MGFAWGLLGFATDSAWDSRRICIQFAYCRERQLDDGK